jgi:paraquat-inducible protein A
MQLSAATAGLFTCATCGLLNRAHAPAPRSRSRSRCARCATPLHARKPHSLGRTWALTSAAYALYLPANLLPVLETGSVGGREADTILGGAARLWLEGSWPLALVIVLASVVVPITKLLALTWLLADVHFGTGASALRATRLYRVVAVIGRWSMVDIYVGGLLVALVNFHPVATITPGPGAIAFGVVVVLTLAAARSFDPRLLWDARRAAHG